MHKLIKNKLVKYITIVGILLTSNACQNEDDKSLKKEPLEIIAIPPMIEDAMDTSIIATKVVVSDSLLLDTTKSQQQIENKEGVNNSKDTLFKNNT